MKPMRPRKAMPTAYSRSFRIAYSLLLKMLEQQVLVGELEKVLRFARTGSSPYRGSRAMCFSATANFVGSAALGATPQLRPELLEQSG